MKQIFVDDGLLFCLGRVISGTLDYHLFTNNVTVSRTTTLGSLVEAAWTGYAAQSKTTLDFPLQSVVGHVGIAQGLPCAFTNGSGSPVTTYGWYITDVSNATIIAAANFDSPPETINPGDSLLVPLVLGDFSSLS